MRKSKLPALIFLTLVYASLVACVNHSLYKSVDRSGYGYSEQKLSEERYRVRFVARGDKPESAEEHALLRAAELCMQEGYSAFKVLRKTTNVAHDNRMDPSQLLHDNDLIGGSLELPGHGSGEAEIAVQGTQLGIGRTASKVITELEIRMVASEAEKNSSLYSASDTYDSLHQKLVTGKSFN